MLMRAVKKSCPFQEVYLPEWDVVIILWKSFEFLLSLSMRLLLGPDNQDLLPSIINISEANCMVSHSTFIFCMDV